MSLSLLSLEWIVGGNCPMIRGNPISSSTSLIGVSNTGNKMKELKLKNDFVVLLDDEDYDFISQFKWYAHKSNSKTYHARRTVWKDGKSATVSMHRTIMNTPNGFECDHINHNGLDNRKSNLRNCTQAENARNRLAFGRVKYLGVSYKKNRGYEYIQARIYSKGKSINLGYFKTLEDAAHAYDGAAKEYHGEFANLNFK